MDPSTRVNWMSLSLPEVQRLTRLRSRCSFLARLTPDAGDVLTAHTTWSGCVHWMSMLMLICCCYCCFVAEWPCTGCAGCCVFDVAILAEGGGGAIWLTPT